MEKTSWHIAEITALTAAAVIGAILAAGAVIMVEVAVTTRDMECAAAIRVAPAATTSQQGGSEDEALQVQP